MMRINFINFIECYPKKMNKSEFEKKRNGFKFNIRKKSLYLGELDKKNHFQNIKIKFYQNNFRIIVYTYKEIENVIIIKKNDFKSLTITGRIPEEITKGFNISKQYISIYKDFNTSYFVLQFKDVNSKSLNPKLKEKNFNFNLTYCALNKSLSLKFYDNFKGITVNLSDEKFLENGILNIEKVVQYLKTNDPKKTFIEDNLDYIIAILEKIQAFSKSNKKLEDTMDFIEKKFIKVQKYFTLEFLYKLKLKYLEYKTKKFEKDVEKQEQDTIIKKFDDFFRNFVWISCSKN